jgi:hypothetical protein
MSEGRERSVDDRAPSVTERRRYVPVRTPNEELLIYDRQHTDAWIQSGATVKLDSMR